MVLVLLALGAVLALALAFLRTARGVAQSAAVVPVPETAKTISYVLLIVLMFGVVTGWLGGL